MRDAAIARVAARYRGCGRSARYTVAGKLRFDPLTPVLLAGPELGAVLDLGCGRGQFAGLLLEAGLATAATGVERDGRLLEQAAAALSGLGFTGRRQDLAQDVALPRADTVLMVDVLYQMAPAAQARLLDAAARAAPRLLIRTADPQAGWRARFSGAVERVGRALHPQAGRTVAPQPLEWIAARLRAAGFAVEAAPSRAGTPFGNALLVAVKPSRH